MGAALDPGLFVNAGMPLAPRSVLEFLEAFATAPWRALRRRRRILLQGLGRPVRHLSPLQWMLAPPLAMRDVTATAYDWPTAY
jgi:hypothetical protein